MTREEDTLARYERYRNSPWDFLCECIYTHDEVDTANPIKPYPSNLAYLKFIVLMWQIYLKIAVPKSRRMTCSWTFLALIVWDTIFHRGRSWAVTSKKEEDAKELVSRCEFMIERIPPEKIPPELIPKMKNGKMQSSPPAIEFVETHSKIQGFPAGADQLRQRGFSGIFEDESAFQEESEETYAAAEPTIRGGGRFNKVSSRAIKDRGFFKKICFDRLDAEDIRFPEVPPVMPKSPMEGVQVWQNPKNEFLVIDLHYTANPAKRGEAFREGLRKTLPIRTFMMEYEKSWETFEGKPVYADFNDLLHVTQIEPQFHIGLPLLLGWDSSGLTPAVVLAQLQEERLVVFKEIIGAGMGAHRFVPLVAETIKTMFPQMGDLETHTISFFDPAGFKKNEVTEQTYIQAMMAGGFKRVFPGPVTWNKRTEAVTQRLTGLAKGQSKFVVYEKDCPTLIAGFRGGYRYSEKILDKEPDRPQAVKDIHSHPHDALQYLCGGLKNHTSTNYNFNIPTPTYGFQKVSTHG